MSHIDFIDIVRPADIKRARLTWVTIAFALVVGLSLSLVGHADAAYEQAREGSGPAQFGKPEEFPARFSYAASMAVNQTGVGGVTPGSLYTTSGNGTVVRLSPGKEGEEPQVEEEWGWSIVSEEKDAAYDRCGPAYQGAANPAEHIYEACLNRGARNLGGPSELPGQFGYSPTIAVDQATGNVYVRSAAAGMANDPRKQHLVQVFTAKGEIIGEGFGDEANATLSPPESIAESPGKLHRSQEGGIAVDDSGTVYLLDLDFVGVEHPEWRVMSFEPCIPGNYESYCHAASKDISLPKAAAEASKISLIGDDRLVIATSEVVQEYPLGAQNPDPVCSQPVTGNLRAMTANELTGEVFWFRYSDKKVHRWAPCDESTAQWTELEAIKSDPKIEDSFALAVNPTKSWGPLRPDGVLYLIERKFLDANGYVFVPAKGGVHPLVQNVRATQTSSSSSVLRGEIDPQGSAVEYHFEYLSDTDYVANGEGFSGPISPARAPASDAVVPSGAVANVAAAITGLSPSTTYHFRLVATSECEGVGQPVCEAVGPAAEVTTFATGVGAILDNRAYELVSPAQKHGGEVFPADGTVYSCPTECKPPGIIGRISPASPMISTASGNAVVYEGFPFSTTEGANANSYVSGRGASGWQTSTRTPALLANTSSYLAYNADLSEGILMQVGGGAVLSADAPAGYANLYLQKAADPSHFTPLIVTTPPNRAVSTWALEYGGRPTDFAAQLFSANDVLTQATAYAPEPPSLAPAESDLYEWRDGALSLVNVLPGNTEVAKGASFASVSPDAHGVSADGSRVFWSAGGKVFVREDGQSTRELQHSGSFLSASANGDEVLFKDGCLYDLASEACTDLTQGSGGFLGLVGQSQDLSRIYFATFTALPGQNERGEEATAGKPNLYLYEAGAATHFIATLDAASDEKDWNKFPVERPAEASPNGRYLAFSSIRKLTDYDNVGPCLRKSTTGGEVELLQGPCREVFSYDSATGQLVCASCNPTGEAPHGPSTLRLIQQSPSWLPQPRYLTNQGRLFFDTQDRLSPLDVNGNVEDVYELEPFGVGSCDREGGCLSLLSSGAGEVDSNFLTMGGEGEREGSDVFFTSRERLVGEDKDELIDVYDAREGGGFAAIDNEPTECQGESCQPVASRPPQVTPASSIFHGAGNLNEAKAKKHKKKKHHKSKHASKKAAKRNAGGSK